MRILKLNLENYRNYRKITIEFQPQGAILYGPNGIGKTNLLESLAYLAFGKSIAGLKDYELINFSEVFFRICAEVEIKSQLFQMEAAADKNNKIIKIDKILLPKISELYKYLKVIYFSPQDIEVIHGSPRKRRQFIDVAISQIKLDYLGKIRRFYRVLKQRNALLKNKYDLFEKKIWDKEYIDLCDQIIKFRIDFLEKITPILREKYSNISEEKEKIELEYKFSFTCDSSDNYKKILSDKIEKNLENEINSKKTLFGPHHDDIDFKINGHSVKKFGSQGQKRSLAIALKLAHTELLEKYDIGKPILIFDDVFADLDKNRTDQIIHLLENTHQIFIATPNISAYRHTGLPEIDIEKINEIE